MKSNVCDEAIGWDNLSRANDLVVDNHGWRDDHAICLSLGAKGVKFLYVNLSRELFGRLASFSFRALAFSAWRRGSKYLDCYHDDAPIYDL